MKGDKIAILGPNGCGKSTLLNVLLGKLQPTSGTIEHAHNLSVSYFDQLRNQLDETQSIIDNVKEGSDFLNINGRETHVITYLQKFLFSPDRLQAPITHLSGGEKNRLLLAKILSKPSNVIVLDEPTNDLDIETLEILEEMMIGYQGTMLLVSHDREFIDNVATSTIVFEPQGLEEYIGGYEEWLRQRKDLDISKDSPKVKNTDKSQKKTEVKAKKSSLTYDQGRILKNLPAQIEKLENNIAKIEEQMSQAGFYNKNKEEIQSAQLKLSELQSEHEEKFMLWEELLLLD
jgi:ATP-binding cassette subfamily F protein uup